MKEILSQGLAMPLEDTVQIRVLDQKGRVQLMGTGDDGVGQSVGDLNGQWSHKDLDIVIIQ